VCRDGRVQTFNVGHDPRHSRQWRRRVDPHRSRRHTRRRRTEAGAAERRGASIVLRSGSDHWGSLAKFFHWTVVLLILVQGTIGLIMVELPKRPRVIPVFSLHKSLGLT